MAYQKRLKTRIRWYGNTFGKVSHPSLEFKLKVIHQIGKLVFALPEINITKGYGINNLQKTISNANIPEPIKNYIFSLSPVLLNSYKREYYLSANAHYRLTIDENLISYKLRHHSNSFVNRSPASIKNILELKYACKYDENSHAVINAFPIRLSKSSKYVEGMQLTRNLQVV